MAKGSNKTRESLPRLTNLYINPTKYCNLRCSHCWVAPPFSEKSTREGEIDIKLLERTVVAAEKLGLRSVKLTGSEPMLYGDLFRLIDFLGKRKLQTTIETNGTLIDNFAVNFFKKAKVKFVSVSLDSSIPVINDGLRRVPGAFDSAVRGLKKLVSTGIPNQVIFSLTKKNLPELYKMPSFARSIGSGSLKVNLVQSMGRATGLEKKGELFNTEEHLKIYREFEKRVLTKDDLPMVIYYDIPLAFQNTAALKTRFGVSHCPIYNLLGILPDGKVSICGIGFTDERTLLGDLNFENIASIWKNSAVLGNIRRDIPKNMRGVCSKCIFVGFCLGKCVANTLHRNAAHNDSFFFCQDAFEMGIFPKTRIVGQKGVTPAGPGRKKPAPART